MTAWNRRTSSLVTVTVFSLVGLEVAPAPATAVTEPGRVVRVQIGPALSADQVRQVSAAARVYAGESAAPR